jgi:TRAP-type uncharacterized transport system substrate-binding protein
VFSKGLAEELGLQTALATGTPAELAQKVLAREIEAFWYGAGLPAPPFFEIASKADAVVFGLRPNEIAGMRRRFPYFSPLEVPAGVYKGQTAVLPSVAVWNFLVAHEGVPEQAAYELLTRRMALRCGSREAAACRSPPSRSLAPAGRGGGRRLRYAGMALTPDTA